MTATKVTIRYLLFRADIDLSNLAEFPPRNFKKLLRLAAKEPHRNEAAIQALGSYFSWTIPEARRQMQTAAQAYLDGYKKVENPKSRRPEVILQLSKNKRLKAEFLRTQAHHDKLIKLKDLFLEMFPTDTKH